MMMMMMMTMMMMMMMMMLCRMAVGQRVKYIDFYRRIPTDLTEATTVGGFLSLCAA
jgi:hypothetical protein